MTAADLLGGLASLARAAGGVIPGKAGTAAQLAGAGLDLAADLAHAGHGPEQIERVVDLDPIFAAARARRLARERPSR